MVPLLFLFLAGFLQGLLQAAPAPVPPPAPTAHECDRLALLGRSDPGCPSDSG